MTRVISFTDVKTILDRAIDAWRERNGRPPLLSTHGPEFGWNSLDELLHSEAFGNPLIQPDVIGTDAAANANIIAALTHGLTGFPRMPVGGPFLSEEDVQTIETWIKAGCPQ
ncbi:hypothetical protein [Bradyrhizobium sp. CCBAU 25360]|uniref:hypothetical protein n=1 Tax=Bradyrhizobium sp. CCBAU 25360 TaxID=858425 RepID=UPI002305E736|nr:hypothetical protein [Bradyrhizobium sp. CCBAU 25360]